MLNNHSSTCSVTVDAAAGKLQVLCRFCASSLVAPRLATASSFVSNRPSSQEIHQSQSIHNAIDLTRFTSCKFRIIFGVRWHRTDRRWRLVKSINNFNIFWWISTEPLQGIITPPIGQSSKEATIGRFSHSASISFFLKDRIFFKTFLPFPIGKVLNYIIGDTFRIKNSAW